MRWVGWVVGGLVALGASAPASARIIQAESILPPGQSGFVSIPGIASGTGSAHLYDQQPLYVDFRWKPAGFGQLGVGESPRAGVTIVRDDYGVPSITGATERDMWWGAGYAVAQDRLFQLEAFRAATTGHLSEIVGKSRLDDDRIVRQDLYTPAELDAMYATEVPAALKMRFEAYRDGINAWIAHVEQDPLDMPAEFPATGTQLKPWTIRDSVAIGVYLARTIPTNSDPEGLELANLRGLQLGGPGLLARMVPLRTRGSLTSVPADNGTFPSQPGRTRAQERAAFDRSVAFAKTLPFPDKSGTGALLPPAPASARNVFVPRLGGSYMFAVRRGDGHAFLYNGQQLGFDMPEKLLELELHAPGIDLRGDTAAGVPIIGGGFNGNGVAWGITTGASDTDDLYAEKLVPGHPEEYVFRGQVRQMQCRNEVLDYRSPPSDLLGGKTPESGSRTVRMCRTVHGPVEARAGNVAYARRYAAWGRELESIVGLAEVNAAHDIRDVDHAMRDVTWNENLIAIDSGGNIGYWHPGLFPLRPRRWDERLPYPGTGEAEWRGLLPRTQIPSVIDPQQNWLASWNNLPSVGWTSGDGTARKRLDGPYFRVGWLMRLVRGLSDHPSFEAMEGLIHQSGTVAQQWPLARSRVRSVARRATGGAATVFRTLLAWDGSYTRTDSHGTVDPGVATWQAFLGEAQNELVTRWGEGVKWFLNENVLAPLLGGYHAGAPYHYFDATHAQSTALRRLPPADLRTAADAAFADLSKRFGSPDPARWREPRRMYPISVDGAGSPPPLPFFDRGTYEQLVETGP